MPFSDRLTDLVTERETQIVLGLDPDPQRLWVEVSSSSDARVAVGRAVTDHCQRVIDAVAESCVAVKPQLACFERLGSPGWEALEAVTHYAQEAGLLVIADGKRGDVSISASAYVQALLGSTPSPRGELRGLDADAITVSPLIGVDALEPFVSAATAGSGVFVLVRTSNPGAADFEDLALADGGSLWEHVASTVNDLGSSAVGSSGLSSLGAVMGATHPEHLLRARELMPTAIFLLPGVGAQGGKVEDLAPAFLPGRAGGLITASRSIVNAGLQGGGDSAKSALTEAERLRELAWEISSS